MYFKIIKIPFCLKIALYLRYGSMQQLPQGPGITTVYIVQTHSHRAHGPQMLHLGMVSSSVLMPFFLTGRCLMPGSLQTVLQSAAAHPYCQGMD